MRLRGRLAWVKWWGALGVALALHGAVFWVWLPHVLPPPVVQPVSTRVLLISLPPPAPEPIVNESVPEPPLEDVESSTPLVVEVSPVEVEVNELKSGLEPLEPDPLPEPEPEPEPELEPERKIVKPEPEPEFEREPKQELKPLLIDDAVAEEKPLSSDDSVSAVEDHVDVDGRFDVPPRALQKIEPNYPLKARRKKREGDVLCQAVITKRGRVEIVSVVLGSGYRELDAAALVALRRARFEPATRRGRSVEATVRITITFRLTGR